MAIGIGSDRFHCALWHRDHVSTAIWLSVLFSYKRASILKKEPFISLVALTWSQQERNLLRERHLFEPITYVRNRLQNIDRTHLSGVLLRRKVGYLLHHMERFVSLSKDDKIVRM
jgi:hypothetical protein